MNLIFIFDPILVNINDFPKLNTIYQSVQNAASYRVTIIAGSNIIKWLVLTVRQSLAILCVFQACVSGECP